MTDSSGAKAWEIESKPFGDGVTITGTATLNLRFPGQYYDSETGNNQNWHRDYTPPLGRYIEADPIGLRGGINLYAYSSNVPTSKTDLQGLCTDCDQCPSGKYHYEGVGYGGFLFLVGAHSSTLKVTCMGKPSVSFTITMTCYNFGGGLGASVSTPAGLSFGCNNKAAEDGILGWSWFLSVYPNPFAVPAPGFGLGVHGSGSLTAAGADPGWGMEGSAGGGYCVKVN